MALESITEAVDLLARGQASDDEDEEPDEDSPEEGEETAKSAAEQTGEDQVKEADLALNGAQVKAFVDVLTGVAEGTLKEQAALVLLESAFPAVDTDKLLVAIRSQDSATVER